MTTLAPPNVGSILSTPRFRAFFKMAAVQIIVWTFFAMVFVPQTYFSDVRQNHITVLGALAESLVDFYPWIIISPAILWLCNRFPFTRQHWLRNVFIHLLASIPIVFAELILVRVLWRILWRLTGQAAAMAPPLYLTLSYSGCFDMLVYWGIVAAGQGIRYYRAAEEHERRLTEAQLQMLRGQLQPHFLFNTLNAAAELVYVRPHSADRVLTNLSDLLRTSLRQERGTVRLQDDLVFVRKYMDIQKELLVDRLRVTYDIQPRVLDATVPFLFIQPLLENAVKHGLAGRAEGGCISVSAHVEDERLEIAVSDDGRGASGQELSASSGIGIANLKARLDQLYRHDHSFRISTSPGKGFSVYINIPYVPCLE
jgi:sensor histidine kinase YesM